MAMAPHQRVDYRYLPYGSDEKFLSLPLIPKDSEELHYVIYETSIPRSLDWNSGSHEYFSGNKGARDLVRWVYSEADSVAVVTKTVLQSLNRAADIMRPIDASTVSRIEAILVATCDLCRKGMVDAAVDRIFEIIETSFADRDLSSIDELLSLADPDKLDSRVTIGMLRATSRAKISLQTSWMSLLAKESARLRKSGRNEKRMLRGLLPANAHASVND